MKVDQLYSSKLERPPVSVSLSPRESRQTGIVRHASAILVTVSLVFFALVVPALFPCLGQGGSNGENEDVDHDGIDDAFEYSLAMRYAPHFIFDPREDYYYSDPSAFIDRCGAELNARFRGYGNPNRPGFEPNDCWRIGLNMGNSYYPPGGYYAPPGLSFSQYISHYNDRAIETADPDMYRMMRQLQNGDRLPWDRINLVPPNWIGKYYLLFDKSLKYAFDPMAPVFFLVEENREGNLELQYWQFSHCDDKNLSTDQWKQVDHLCDWSRIAIVFRIANGNVIEPPWYAFYSCHKSPINDGNAPFNPRYLLWQDVHCDAGGHPIVLVSHNQHELYFENAWQLVLPYPGITYETDMIRSDTGCNIRPYFIRREVNHDYFDQVGHGIDFIPGSRNLVNMFNGDYPNPNLPWLTFGGNWADGPEGPLGLGASVRFREHNVWQDAPVDDGSVQRVYRGLVINGGPKWRIQCRGGAVDIVRSVLVPQGFMATARACANGQWPH